MSRPFFSVEAFLILDFPGKAMPRKAALHFPFSFRMMEVSSQEKTPMHTLSTDAVCVVMDFETADYQRDSACAIGLAKVQGGKVTETFYSLIRPPRKRFYFTHIHGITWAQAATAPSFSELWPDIQNFLLSATHLAAHNAPFDRGVLEACCAVAGIAPPPLPYICTLKESRRLLRLPSHSLDSLCRHFQITLSHHHAGSDAQAAAELLLRLQSLPR